LIEYLLSIDLELITNKLPKIVAILDNAHI